MRPLEAQVKLVDSLLLLRGFGFSLLRVAKRSARRRLQRPCELFKRLICLGDDPLLGFEYDRIFGGLRLYKGVVLLGDGDRWKTYSNNTFKLEFDATLCHEESPSQKPLARQR